MSQYREKGDGVGLGRHPHTAMTWATQASHALAAALRATFDADGVVVAAAALDVSGTAVAVDPSDTAADCRFEIGSVTKTMTATLLALLAGRGVLRLDDQVGRWLSAGPNEAITLRELATHSSGLPQLGPDRRSRSSDSANPWAGYTFEDAERDLRQSTVTPGRPHLYSNLGYQLLGLVLQRASGQDYPTLVTECLLDSLEMAHSGVGSRGLGTLLTGHAEGRPVASWERPWGAGGVEATIADLAQYARACLFPRDTPLGEAITLAQTPVVRVAEDIEQALGWIVLDDGVREHSGGTGGFSASVTLDHARGRAVALLASSGGSPVYSTYLKQAAHLALADQDPRRAAAPRPWPVWREDACDVVRALLNGQVGQVYERLAPQVREKVAVQQLERAWSRRIEGAGSAEEIVIVHHEIAAGGAVMAELSLAFATGPQRLRLLVLPSGELGGFTFLPSAS